MQLKEMEAEELLDLFVELSDSLDDLVSMGEYEKRAQQFRAVKTEMLRRMGS